jgi:hypothetical protein
MSIDACHDKLTQADRLAAVTSLETGAKCLNINAYNRIFIRAAKNTHCAADALLQLDVTVQELIR